jgi:AcrR family transcriptional regulator
MPRPRFLKLSQAKRDAILAAAQEEFAQHGFDAASYNRIIAQAGLSKGAMYYYFDDKLDLYATVLEEANRVMMAAMGFDAGWVPADDFWASVRDVSSRAWRFTLEHPEIALLFKGLTSLTRRDVREGRLAELFGAWRGMLVALLEAGQAQGQVRTDLSLDLLVEIAMALDEAMDLWLLEHLDALADDPVETVVDMVLDLWKRLLAPSA